VSKTVEEKKQNDTGCYSVDDKWNSLRAYRKSKGMWFVCGERRGRDHQCKQNIQLHIVQEMLDCLQQSNDEALTDSPAHPEQQQQLMQLSVMGSTISKQAVRSMQIVANIQGHELHFLINSGSSACFLDCRCAANFQGAQPLPQSVQVVAAGGELLQCTHHF
jgi:hypothetical protein